MKVLIGYLVLEAPLLAGALFLHWPKGPCVFGALGLTSLACVWFVVGKRG